MGATDKQAGFVRRLGLGAAAAVGLVFVAIVLYFVTRPPAPQPADAVPGEVPDILSQAERGQGIRMGFVDKSDPTRTAGTFEGASIEPVDVGVFSVGEPRAWVYLRDGQFAYVTAESGRLVWPNRPEPPESGRLRGNVVIRLYPPTSDGLPPDPSVDEPSLTATTTHPLDFDLRFWRMSTAERLEVVTPEMQFAGRGVRANFNRLRERLEALEIEQGEYLRFVEADDRAAAGSLTDRGGPPPGGPPQAGSGTPARGDGGATGVATIADAPQPIDDGQDPGPKIDLYDIVFRDGIQVTRASQRIRSDALELFVRLVDNELPPGAVRRFDEPLAPRAGAAVRPASGDRTGPDEPRAVASRPPGDGDPAPAFDAGPANWGPDNGGPDDGVFELTWTGPMRISPIDGDPPEALQDNDMALRFTAERTGLVTYDDERSGASGRMTELSYGLTTGELVLSGPGAAVTLLQPNSGAIVASRIVTSVADGLVHVRGVGVLSQDQTVGSVERITQESNAYIRWSDQADFEFATVDGRMSTDLLRATFSGDVEGKTGAAVLTGSVVDATFVAAQDGQRRLDAVLIDDAMATDGEGGRMKAGQMSVAFTDGAYGDDADPTRLIATGGVDGVDASGTSIAAESLDVELRRERDGTVGIGVIETSGAVRYAGADGTRAIGTRIRADADAQTAEVVGAPAIVGQGDSLITGGIVLLDNVRRRARVDGPGSFEHQSPDGVSVVAKWNDGMRFDDLAGSVECEGDAEVTATDALEVNTLRSKRVVLALKPGGTVDQQETESDIDRRLIRATAHGTADEKATVESRVYAADRPDRVERLTYLEGATLIADNERGVFEAPGTGVLLLLDRRAAGESSQDPGLPIGEVGPGLTRFSFAGGMQLERATGVAVMDRTVRVRHKSLATQDIIELDCERLTAQLSELDGVEGSAGSEIQGELRSVQASGAVYLKMNQRELIADRLAYDAETGKAIASAVEGNLVTLFDGERGTSQTARTLYWDLTTDRIEVDRPGGAVVPREGD